MGYEKAVLIPEGGKKEIKVQFNPAEYNLSRSTTYAEKKFWVWMTHLPSISPGKLRH